MTVRLLNERLEDSRYETAREKCFCQFCMMVPKYADAIDQ